MATYTKLRSGEWGIRVTEDEPPEEGTVVTVSKSNGEKKTETVDKVIWSGDGVHLCSIKRAAKAKAPAPAGSLRNRRTGCACGSIEGDPQDTDCFSCRQDYD